MVAHINVDGPQIRVVVHRPDHRFSHVVCPVAVARYFDKRIRGIIAFPPGVDPAEARAGRA